jgi:hypothetical protein
MAPIRRIALYAFGLTLHAASLIAAQPSPGAKESPKKPAQAAPRSSPSEDHEALTRANRNAESQAQALYDQATKEDGRLTKAMVTTHAQAIGQALESGRRHLAALVANAPPQTNADHVRIEAMRDDQEKAFEHHRALVEMTNQPQLDYREVQEEAEGIVLAVKAEEEAHGRMPGMLPAKPAGKTR